MTGWAIDAALASALLIGAVLLVRVPIRRLFGPTVAYALWALPALRLVLPPTPERWRDDAATPISQAGDAVVHIVAGPVTTLQPAPASIALVLWLAGGTAFLGWHLLGYAAFRARILRHHQDLLRVGRVRVVLSGAATGPLAFGIVRPHVAMPADLDRIYDADERALALAHELGHHARGDLVANWIALLVLAVHWWNPLAWIAHRAFRADQELANDARVLRERGPSAAHAYACAILKAAGGRGHAAACQLRSISDLKGRIRMLKAGPVSPRRLATGAATVAFLAATTLAFTASGTRAAAAATQRVGDTIGVDLAAAELDLAALRMSVPPTPSLLAVAQLPPTPPVPRSAPTSPATPSVPIGPTPPLPPTPPVASSGDADVTVTRIRAGDATRRVIRPRDGRDLDLSEIREVRERRCGSGDGSLVRQEIRGGRPVTVICTDRIEHFAQAGARAEVDGERIERDALNSALQGLRAGRIALDSDETITGEQKRRARGAMEQAIREIEESLAKLG